MEKEYSSHFFGSHTQSVCEARIPNAVFDLVSMLFNLESINLVRSLNLIRLPAAFGAVGIEFRSY